MRTQTILLGLVLAGASASACGSSGSGGAPHAVGETSFESPPPGGAVRGGTADVAGAPSPTSAAPGGTAAPRTIEEADIYKVSGSTLYVLNAYRGLQILDLADLAQPRLVGRVPILGRPVDLYLRGTTAFVAVSDYFFFYAVDSEARPDRGSRLFAVDVADPTHPRVLAELPIEGEVTDTRLVGDVLYVVSRDTVGYRWVGFAGGAATSLPAGSTGVTAVGSSPAGADSATVASFDVSDPSHPREAARLTLPASGWQTHANVTADRITLSFSGWEASATGSYGPVTRFRVVDSSDPGGALAAGAELEAPGEVRDRWAMDHDGARGIFRAVLANGWNAGAVLQTWSSPAPGAAELLSRLSVDVAESLTAARFDGDRVYLVTSRSTDPLWAIDASDPRAPVVEGALHMPGQLDFIEPRGDRLVALGHTAEAGKPFQLAVSLIDVADLAAPELLARQTFGESFGWVSASPDDLRKAFIVLDPPAGGATPGLVLVPVQGWDRTSWRFAGGTQLLDLTRDALALRGFLAHPGAIARAFPLDAGRTRLVALSDLALQTMDATDRAAPVELARLDLARPVTNLALVGGAAVELAGDWARGDMELVTTDALDPDAAAPLARVHVAAPSARLFQDGAVAWLLARDWATGQAWLEAVDLADPAQPVRRGRLDVAPEDAVSGGGRFWGYGDEAVLAGHVLAVHRTVWTPCQAACAEGGVTTNEVRLYDLSDPDRPRLASRVPLASSWAWGLQAVGPHLWLTHYEWNAPGAERGRYYLDRIDVADPARPRLLEKVNVPGVFFAASEDGARVYTLETWWGGEQLDRPSTWLHALTLDGPGRARLLGSAGIAGYPAGAAASGGAAWVAAGDGWYASGTTRLSSVDLGAMKVTSEQAVQGDASWLRCEAGGKLFLEAGWRDQGMIIYDLADPRRPAFERFVRTQGWVQDVVVGNGLAYLPSGPYGVPMVTLDPR